MKIFVFGSNTQGRHGKGAAKHAYDFFGAVYLKPRGLQGCSYAIVTKELRKDYPPITPADIAAEVEEFKKFAADRPGWTFEVSAIGCGLAGFTPEQIGPMFKGSPSNVNMPEVFKPYV